MHALDSWCERYRSGTGARQSDRSGLWIKTRSALRLYFARSAPRSLRAPLHSHALVRVLDWPACSPDLSPIENVWRILKRKMRQRRPRTVAHFKTCLQEEWDKITPETLHHLVSSVPKSLLSVMKRNGNITKW